MKNYNRKTIFAVGLIICLCNTYSQSRVETLPAICPRESLVVHISHESAFTGEICFFKVYCSSSLFPGKELSDLAYIELVGNDNTSIIRKKILLNQGEGIGDFEIPDNLPTGLYYIISYTNWMKNFGEGSFFRKEFAIINPRQPFHGNSDSTISSGNTELLESIHTDQAELIPDKNTYALRERVTLIIRTAKREGRSLPASFSVSVIRKEPGMVFNANYKPENPIIGFPAKLTYKPDYRGVWLSGKMTDRIGLAVPDMRITLSMPGPGTDIISSISDSTGNFEFLLKPKEGEHDIVIEVPGPDLKIDLRESFWNGFRDPPENPALRLDQMALDFLKEKYSFYQLESKFKKSYPLATDATKDQADSSVFYSKPYQVIKMSNYINLDSLREYFYELVPSVKFLRKKGGFDISVIDPRTSTFIEDKPGVFLDGVKFDDFGRLAAIPVGEIDRMTILPATYYYKDLTFGGIIDIHTKKSDFNAIKPLPAMIRFRYPMANSCGWKFISPDYNSPDSQVRIPDFRYLLHWEPYVKTDNSGETTVHFYTGDLKGIYIVKVTGISEIGEILQSEKDIYVGGSHLGEK